MSGETKTIQERMSEASRAEQFTTVAAARVARDAALELLRDVVPTVADARRGAIASWLDGDWWSSRDALLNGPSAGADTQ